MNKPNDYGGLQLVGAIRKLQSKDAAIEQLESEIAELKKDSATAFWVHPKWGNTTLPPSTWPNTNPIGDKNG